MAKKTALPLMMMMMMMMIVSVVNTLTVWLESNSRVLYMYTNTNVTPYRSVTRQLVYDV